ncbi:MAG TPA: sporulation protein YqfD [Bacillales bacterium]|nr:sporulation protein YqfD [Bacillales bacterium]
MDKHWMDKAFGQVRIIVRGRRTEQFMNRCLEHNITLSNIVSRDASTIECTLPAGQIKEIRPLLKHSDCRFHIVERRGIPFFIRRLSFKKGFVVGMIVFAAVLFVLSNMLWRVEIQGADPQTEQEISEVLQKLGVQPGKFIFSLPPEEDIQQEIAASVEKVSWVSLKIKGTTYQFDVVEKELPKKEKALTPRNLVAEKEAIIHDIYAEKGKPVVEPEDYVQKGDVLISGVIGGEERNKRVAAKGKVWGETWYESKVTLPLTTELKTHTGNSYVKRSLELFGFRLPYWGFAGPDFRHYDTRTKTTPLKFLQWELPIRFVKETLYETKRTKRTYSKKQAVAKARSVGKHDVLQKIGPGGKILSEKVLRETVENGKVKVFLYYTVIENIATEQPLIDNKETE